MKFKLGFLSVIRSKRHIIGMFILGILISVWFVLNTANATVYNFLHYDTYKSYENRQLAIGRDLHGVEYEDIADIENEIMSVDHVLSSFFNFYSYGGGVIDEFKGKLSGDIDFKPANNDSLLPITYGSNFPDDDGLYMVCPENFYPTRLADIKSLNINYKVDLRDKIGDVFHINATDWVTNEKYKVEIKLTGLYKNQANQIDEDICFVSKSVAETIAKIQSKSDSNWSVSQYSLFMTTVDDINNIDYVSDTLSNMGYKVIPVTEIIYEYYDNIFNIIKKLNLALIIMIIVIVFIYTRKDYIENKDFYRLLQYTGYNKIQIFMVFISEIIIKLTLSIIFSIMISLLLYGVVNLLVYYKPFIINKWTIVFDYLSYIQIYLFLFILFVIIYGFNYLWKKEN